MVAQQRCHEVKFSVTDDGHHDEITVHGLLMTHYSMHSSYGFDHEESNYDLDITQDGL